MKVEKQEPKLRILAAERARSMFERGWGHEMAKYKTFGVKDSQKDDFAIMLAEEIEKLAEDKERELGK